MNSAVEFTESYSSSDELQYSKLIFQIKPFCDISCYSPFPSSIRKWKIISKLFLDYQYGIKERFLSDPLIIPRSLLFI